MTALRQYAADLAQPVLEGSGPDGSGLDSSGLRFDEVVAADGRLRDPWRHLAAEGIDLSTRELRRVDREIRRFLTDDAVTVTPPGGATRPWRLDPVPLVIEADDWSVLEKGLTQRAEVLEAALGDLYGERTLLRDGVVPPAAVFAHPGFVRALSRPSMRGAHHLPLAAFDLARAPDGQWRVLGDRTQAPSGIGFAMENRRVLSRVLPRAYRTAGLHRLTPYFSALRSSILQAGPVGVDNPRVVVLSPGPVSETAYDQAFIASNLGFPLVEGHDLVVRDGFVWLQGYGRPERVDVVVRRVDAAWSDPLELRGESQLGVAGLTEAARRGTVTLVNGLGAGVHENLALLPYTAAMCEHLLGESLRLPSHETFWAGDPAHLERILDDLEALRVRRVDAPTDAVDPEGLQSRILSAPHAYVASAKPLLSVAPTWDGQVLQPRGVTFRAFTMRYGSTYRPLVGGLAMAGESRAHPGISKDVWVLKSSGEEPDQGLAEVMALTSVPAPAPLVPRVLDDLFWLGRYGERAEDMVRLVIATHVLAEDFSNRPWSSGGQALRGLVEVIAGMSATSIDPEDFTANFRSLLLDDHRSGSVAESVSHLREIAQSVRDQVSGDLFRVFGSIDRAVGALARNEESWQIGDTASAVLTDLLAVYGVTANMMRDEGWRLIEIGRSLERALQLVLAAAPVLSRRWGIDVDRDLTNALLQATESAITHRRRYRGFVRVTNVVDLLFLDAQNPRSMRGCLESLRDHLAALPASTGSTRPERIVDDLVDLLDEVDTARLNAIEGEFRPHLVEFFEQFRHGLSRLGEAIAEVHFAPGPAQLSLDEAVVIDEVVTVPGAHRDGGDA